MSYSNFSAVSSEEQKTIERERINPKLDVSSSPETERHSQREPPDPLRDKKERSDRKSVV